MHEMHHPHPILVLVEDDADTEMLVLRILNKIGIRAVVVLRDGQDAIDWFTQSSARPLLVLLDMKLPRVDGLDVLREIRSMVAAKSAAIVMFSTVGTIETVTRAMRLGANDFAVKPVDTNRLQNVIHDLVGKHMPTAMVG